ncbi:MAG: hypothetical protein Q9225_005359 [Loekoesia sp. 1 TL-2023]
MDSALENSICRSRYVTSSQTETATAGTPEPYPGLPLQYPDSIRLIAFDPVAKAFRVTFINVRLSDAPQYVALSYTWDQPLVPAGQRFRGLRFSHTLLDAIEQFRHISACLWWIDALCINQDDPVEKAGQVRMMRTICETAYNIYVWLGPEDADSEPAINLMRKLQHFAAQRLIDKDDTSIEFSDKELRKRGFPLKEDPSWISLLKTIDRPYFRRMWVIQELAAGKESKDSVSAFLGNRYCLSWYLMALSIQCFRELRWQTQLQLTLSMRRVRATWITDDVINVIWTVRAFQSNDLSIYEKLHIYLESFRAFQTSDPRDKINALYGLITAKDQKSCIIMPDYSVPASDIYRDVTGKMIIGARSFELLSTVNAIPQHQIPNLPSWVPDYSTRSFQGHNRPYYKASGVAPFVASWSPGSNALQAHAAFVDEVTRVSDLPRSRGDDNKAPFLAWLSMAAEVCSSNLFIWMMHLFRLEPDDEGPKGYEQFWRTACGNAGFNHYPVLTEYGWIFRKALVHGFLNLLGDQDELVDLISNFERLMGFPDGHLGNFASADGADDSMHFWNILNEITSMRTFFYTKSGRMGLGPLSLQPGDQIAIFSGGRPIYFPREHEEYHEFLGDGCIHGLMNGEGVPENGQSTEIQLR